MLTKMPKVGDVVIANENGWKRYTDVTVGEEYAIIYLNDGDAIFLDDMRDECYIDKDRFECFTIKGEVVAESVGFIEISQDGAQDGKFTHFGIKTDSAGFKAIKALAEQSQKQRKRTEIQSQIDALQAELNAL